MKFTVSTLFSRSSLFLHYFSGYTLIRIRCMHCIVACPFMQSAALLHIFSPAAALHHSLSFCMSFQGSNLALFTTYSYMGGCFNNFFIFLTRGALTVDRQKYCSRAGVGVARQLALFRPVTLTVAEDCIPQSPTAEGLDLFREIRNACTRTDPGMQGACREKKQDNMLCSAVH